MEEKFSVATLRNFKSIGVVIMSINNHATDPLNKNIFFNPMMVKRETTKKKND
jgi:hypothetical protein